MRATYVITTIGPALTRVSIENGEALTEAYQVTGIAVLSQGVSRYDANSVATLTGTVGGVVTRQKLKVALTSGGVTSLTGFDSTTLWDSAPKVTVTRWSGEGAGATFLVY